MERKLLALIFLSLPAIAVSCGYASNADPQEPVSPGPTSLAVNPEISVQIANFDSISLAEDEHEIVHRREEYFHLQNYLVMRVAPNFLDCLTKEEFEVLDLSTLTDELRDLDIDGNPTNNQVTLLVCPTAAKLTMGSSLMRFGEQRANGPVIRPTYSFYDIDMEDAMWTIQHNGGYGMPFDLLETSRSIYEMQEDTPDLLSGSADYMNTICRPFFYDYLIELDQNNKCKPGLMCLRQNPDQAPLLLDACDRFFHEDYRGTDYLNSGAYYETSFYTEVKFNAREQDITQGNINFPPIALNLSGSIFPQSQPPADPIDPEDPAPTSPIRTLDPVIDTGSDGSIKLNRATMAY